MCLFQDGTWIFIGICRSRLKCIRWYEVICFVDFTGIIDHQPLNFLFIILSLHVELKIKNKPVSTSQSLYYLRTILTIRQVWRVIRRYNLKERQCNSQTKKGQKYNQWLTKHYKKDWPTSPSHPRKKGLYSDLCSWGAAITVPVLTRVMLLTRT